MPPGPRPKPAERRQRRNEPKKAQVQPIGDSASITALSVPPAAKHWRALIKTQWRELWTHPIAQAIDRTVHQPHVRRLFDFREEREELMSIVRASPLVEGSQGQDRPNPLYGRLAIVEAEILKLEKEIGLTPKAGLDLGMQFNEARKSLDDLARSAGADYELEDEEDPRLSQGTTEAKIIDAKTTDA